MKNRRRVMKRCCDDTITHCIIHTDAFDCTTAAAAVTSAAASRWTASHTNAFDCTSAAASRWTASRDSRLLISNPVYICQRGVAIACAREREQGVARPW